MGPPRWNSRSWGDGWQQNSQWQWKESSDSQWNDDQWSGSGRGGATVSGLGRGRASKGSGKGKSGYSSSSKSTGGSGDVRSASQQVETPKPVSRQMLDQLQLTFCPNPGPRCFTSTFDAKPDVEMFGSVNAGNGRSLRLGGSGLNGQFEKDLAGAGQPTAEFQRIHQDLMRLACTSPGKLVSASQEAVCRHGGLAAAFAIVADRHGTGFVAIDVLLEKLRPLHPANAAMVYCVGPDRRQCDSDAEFIASLELLGRCLAQAVASFNRVAEEHPELQPLQKVRVGLVAGGKYAGSVTKTRVAAALITGLAVGSYESSSEDAKARGLSPSEFELAFDEGAFEEAWNELRRGAA